MILTEAFLAAINKSGKDVGDTKQRRKSPRRFRLRAAVNTEDIMGEASSELSDGYYLERDPDVLVLRRVDGSLAAAFSNQGGCAGGHPTGC